MTINDSELAGRRAVFLDIDGTYADHGVVPAGHADVVRRARAGGHVVLLCTGRPKAMVPPRILDAGFDGLVAGAGAYVEVGGEVLADVRFDPVLAARTVAVLDAHDVAYLLEAPDGLHGSPGVGRRIVGELDRSARANADRADDNPGTRPGIGTGPGVGPGAGPGMGTGHAGAETSRDILAVLRTSSDLAAASFGKVTCFDSRVAVWSLAAEIGPEVGALPSTIPGLGDSAGELYLVGMHKAVGMRIVMKHLGLDRSRVVAVGDSLNDVEMLEEAGTAVAVDGAPAAVLAVADRVVPGPERAGLVGLFAELDLR